MRGREPHEALDELAHGVIGAALEVHRILGPGFLEHVYENALGVELAQRGFDFRRQHSIVVAYKGTLVGEARLDFLIGDELVLELKAVDELRPLHAAQVLSYLRAGEFQLGLLINFNGFMLRDGIRRIVWTG